MTIYIPDSAFAAGEERYLAALNGLTIANGPDGAELSLACSEPAHRLCASKRAAHDFFQAEGFPQPHDFPDGSEPYIVKPSDGSCGRGIWSTEDYCEAGGGVNAGFLVQEELHGSVLSVAVAGHRGRVAVCPAVRLIMDDRYDRCGAEYPCTEAENAALAPLALRLGQALALEGMLELKAVVTADGARILSLNEGLPALAATALHFGAGLDPIGAMAALAEGRKPVFGGGRCRVRLEIDGRPGSVRGAGRLGTLAGTDGGVSDGRVRLLTEN